MIFVSSYTKIAPVNPTPCDNSESFRVPLAKRRDLHS